MQIPPLQWINLSRLVKGGSAPVPLRDASIAYDPAKRALIVFGGESAAGTPVQNTWILDFDSLVWRTPVPPDSQRDIPPARSAALTGADLASNIRSGFLVFGGKGGSGSTPLNDVWYYSYQNEFWAKLVTNGTSPSPRWNSAGGTTPRSSIQNVETYMFVVGGQDSTSAASFDQVWQLSVTGIMAAGLNGALGTWSTIPADENSRPQYGKFGSAGTVIPPWNNTDREGSIVVFGGCDSGSSTTGVYDATCAGADGHILTLPTSMQQTEATWTPAAPCPAGMYGATVAPNRNPTTAAFHSEVFLFPGSIDRTLWEDKLTEGEIGVLTASSGVWARVLPAADPSSTPPVPTAKEGVAVYSYSSSVTGGTSNWSDTIVFGGKDVVTGQLTNDLWILRSYNDIIESNTDEWSGYGNGQLQSGLTATGAGVKVQFLPDCAKAVLPTTTSSSPDATSTSIIPSPSGISGNRSSVFDTSPIHKFLSPFSVAFIVLAVLLYRHSSGPATTPTRRRSVTTLALACLSGLAGYALGIVGFALSATPKMASSRVKRAITPLSATFLSTDHSRAAFVLFLMLYAILPVLGITLIVLKKWPKLKSLRKRSATNPPKLMAELEMNSSPGVTPPEKTSRASDDVMMRSKAQISSPGMLGDESPNERGGSRSPSLRRTEALIESASSTLKRQRRGSEPPSSFQQPRFEVTNRPRRLSQTSGGTTGYPPRSPANSASHHAKNLADVSWLARRRSVGTVGDLDFALSQRTTSPAPNSAQPFVAQSSLMLPPAAPRPLSIPPRIPNKSHLAFNALLQLTLLFTFIFWIVTFSLDNSIIGIVITIVVALAFYTTLLILAWFAHPRRSLLVVAITRLSSPPLVIITQTSPPSPPEHVSISTSNQHPYFHQPLYRAHDESDVHSRVLGGGARSTESGAIDEDEDDDEGQAQMEEEMARRDVSIFTVPKRKLVVRN